MNERPLNAFQVAALLVSASYGIGFLFGSGEMALVHGMGGSLYGLATGLGMVLLALFASRLWRTGLPVWELFGRSYGPGLQKTVALLSVVWMAGVLAAQIHGGVAIVKMLGAGEPLAYAVVLGAIFAASRLNLRSASTVFSFFLLLSAVMLVYVLITGGGTGVYMDSPRRFVDDLSTFRPAALPAIVIAVVALVATGADYHQFVLAARRPGAAVWGCVLAGVCLIAFSPLPASVVIALQDSGSLAGVSDGRQVVPWALSRAAQQIGPGLDSIMLLGLSAAALGSGAAIVRAMSGALAAAAQALPGITPPRTAIAALAIGAVLAARGQGIVDTMVSVNVIYIGSVALVFASLLGGGLSLTGRQAALAVALGFAGSFGVYVAVWTGYAPSDNGDLLSLLSGVGASTLVLLGLRVRLWRGHRLGGTRRVE